MKFCESLSGRKKSRDLHIRKISFSGSSVSSGSFSSTSSCATARDDSSCSTAFVEALSSHPTFPHAPPRLHNRPLIPLDGRRYQDVSAFCDDSDDDDLLDLPHHNQRRRRYHTQGPSAFSACSSSAAVSSSASAIALAITTTEEEDMEMMMMMQHGAAPSMQSRAGPESDESCFFLHLAPLSSSSLRPQMPPSRWSESTIATMQTFDEFDAPSPSASVPTPGASMACVGEGAGAIARAPRPGMKRMDTFEDFVKRGGWKRRGIVFHSEDMAGGFSDL